MVNSPAQPYELRASRNRGTSPESHRPLTCVFPDRSFPGGRNLTWPPAPPGFPRGDKTCFGSRARSASPPAPRLPPPRLPCAASVRPPRVPPIPRRRLYGPQLPLWRHHFRRDPRVVALAAAAGLPPSRAVAWLPPLGQRLFRLAWRACSKRAVRALVLGRPARASALRAALFRFRAQPRALQRHPAAPAWSPRGRRLGVQSLRSGRTRIASRRACLPPHRQPTTAASRMRFMFICSSDSARRSARAARVRAAA